MLNVTVFIKMRQRQALTVGSSVSAKMRHIKRSKI